MDEPISADRRNIKLVLAYNGAAYHGWQRQARGMDTIQERIEDAATRILGHRAILHGAGRTDAGVHAEGQVASFFTDRREMPLHGLRRALNSRLPADIVIRSANDVPADFHASRSAVGKTYRYRLLAAPSRHVASAGLVYHYWRPLDVEPMRLAARRLLGTHDFIGLASSSEERQTTVRTIYRCDVAEIGPEIHVSVQGNGFLYKMVRNLVGTLIEIGRGRWAPEQIDVILESLDRRNAGPTAPPDGLTLLCVHYENS